jgi:hypothetical protein
MADLQPWRRSDVAVTRNMPDETKAGLPILAFADRAAFERWIDTQPPDCPGLWVKFARKGSGAA